MSRERTVPAVMEAPTHNGVMKRCVVMTETAIHTIALPEGHFTAMVFSRTESDVAAIVILDRDEAEAQIALLQNAIEDAERLDAGLSTKHAAESLVRS
jgi:uncharacterized small protein (DUF1192 family)